MSGTKLYRWGKPSELQRYRCRHCNHTFNALTGTALARLRHKDKWFDYEQAMVQGVSVRKAAVSCGVTTNTSFKWRHRFLRTPALHQSPKMNGIVEADEMYFLESFKGQHHLPRAARKRGRQSCKRGTSKNRYLCWYAIVMVKLMIVYCMTQAQSKSEQCVSPLLSKDVILCTDGMPAYRQITRNARIVHRPVNIAAGSTSYQRCLPHSEC
ncbi:MAG: IS1595 family transposase [Nitrosomonas sp.]|nr:IS1595 family transposase [Nitrosomonas sp.]